MEIILFFCFLEASAKNHYVFLKYKHILVCVLMEHNNWRNKHNCNMCLIRAKHFFFFDNYFFELLELDVNGSNSTSTNLIIEKNKNKINGIII